MNGTLKNSSFFSFGVNDSYISKSHAGLKHRYLSQSLQDLVRNAINVHWAALGTHKDSWILSFQDSSGNNTVCWGSEIPHRLKSILAKTWHSLNLRFFLGQDDSFIVWHPELIRWANLPQKLEDTIQSWLTPSGWKVGPPRIVTWGPIGAFFAMSEYGDVAYKLGDDNEWQMYKETVEEWKAERGFLWSELAFITLDPTSTDQFVAIRKDGTWGGSSDDVNQDTLDLFANNFFSKAQSKHKSRPTPSSAKGERSSKSSKSNDLKPDAATQALYNQWSLEVATMIAAASLADTSKGKPPRRSEMHSPSNPQIPSVNSSAKLLTSFPYLPKTVTTCALTACLILKSEPDSIDACQHDVEKLLRASGLYCYEWLRQERLRWHPDRFGRLCAENWRETGLKMAVEMFKLMGALIEGLAAHDGKGMRGGAS